MVVRPVLLFFTTLIFLNCSSAQTVKIPRPYPTDTPTYVPKPPRPVNPLPAPWEPDQTEQSPTDPCTINPNLPQCPTKHGKPPW
jgi:hypothetical protein